LKASGVLYDAQEGFNRPDVKKAFEDGNFMAIQKSMAAMRLESMESDLKNMFHALDEFKPTVMGYGILSLGKALMYSIARIIPVVQIMLQVMLPVQDKAPAGLPTLPFGMNRLWFTIIMLGAKKSLTQLHTKAKAALGIDFSNVLTMEYFKLFFWDMPSLPAPSFVGISSAVIPVHPEWPRTNLNICGFFIVDKETQEALVKQNVKGADLGADTHDELMKFVQSGTPPVYIGWGSMFCQSAEFMSKIAVGALRHIGARGVICAGWAGISKETTPAELHEYCDENVLFVKSAPHEVLFPQCACIVHHGGCGTTAASVRSGKPTVIMPVMGDQFDFADGINKINCGVGLPQFSKVTAVQLGNAVKKCLEDQAVINAAKDAGDKVKAENGCENFARAFDEWYGVEFTSGKWLEKHNALMAKSRGSTGCCTM